MADGRDFFGGRLSPTPAFQVRSYIPARRPARARTSAAGQDMFWFLFAGSIAGFVLLVFQPNRERIREARAECRLLEQEIAELGERAAHLRRWAVARGAGDRDAWASVARERLGWLAPGERVLGSRSRPRRPDNVVTDPTGPGPEARAGRGEVSFRPGRRE